MRLDVGKCMSAGLRHRVTGHKLAALTHRNELYGIIVTGQVSSFPDQKRPGLVGRGGKAAYGCPGEAETLKNLKVQVFCAQK